MTMPIRTLDPHLRAGWEPDTPVEDTLLRAFLVNWTLSIEAQGKPFSARTLRSDDLAAVDVGRPSVGGNVATLLAPLFSEDVSEVMAALDDFYDFASGEKSGAVYLFSPWPSPDLQPSGWTLVDYQPLMLRPVGGEAQASPPGLRIEEVHDEAGLRAFETAIVDGFPISELAGQAPGAAFKVEMLADERQRLWVGWEGERPVSAASAFVTAGVNNVTLVATLPEARGRGYGAALTWRATLADPDLPTMLLATDDGRPVYERLGYLSLFRFTLWARNRSSAQG
jgi:GNAT superfamily N-acetyltransferase